MREVTWTMNPNVGAMVCTHADSQEVIIQMSPRVFRPCPSAWLQYSTLEMICSLLGTLSDAFHSLGFSAVFLSPFRFPQRGALHKCLVALRTP
jgi:hypothetical protein